MKVSNLILDKFSFVRYLIIKFRGNSKPIPTHDYDKPKGYIKSLINYQPVIRDDEIWDDRLPIETNYMNVLRKMKIRIEENGGFMVLSKLPYNTAVWKELGKTYEWEYPTFEAVAKELHIPLLDNYNFMVEHTQENSRFYVDRLHRSNEGDTVLGKHVAHMLYDVLSHGAPNLIMSPTGPKFSE